MGQRTQYTPGTFSWSDLSTTDQPAAKSFYSQLLGWEGDDQPIGEGAVYSMMKLGGQDAAAIATQQQQQRDAGVPPVWNSYVTVESADQAAERAASLGGTVHAPPFDVMDVGRMAVIQDPQGAFFMPWEPRAHIGASVVNAPGALCWNELHTSDLDAARTFYGELFGWTFSPFEGSPDPYFIIQRPDGGTNGAVTAGLQPGVPPHWLVYFGTDDTEAALARVQELGGQTLIGPMSIGDAGSIGVAQDPQGAVFALYAGRFDE